MPTYYLMRVKGKAKIPDYIQLRDESMTLIGYFRPGRKERLLKVVSDEFLADQLQQAIEALEDFGRLHKITVQHPSTP